MATTTSPTDAEIRAAIAERVRLDDVGEWIVYGPSWPYAERAPGVVEALFGPPDEDWLRRVSEADIDRSDAAAIARLEAREFARLSQRDRWLYELQEHVAGELIDKARAAAAAAMIETWACGIQAFLAEHPEPDAARTEDVVDLMGWLEGRARRDRKALVIA